MRFLFPLLFTLLVFILIACGPENKGSSTPNQLPPPGPGPEKTAGDKSEGNLPDMVLERVDGKGDIHLRSYAKDKVVIIVFWATWCESCKGELVGLKSFYKKYSVKGLEVLAVSMDTPDTASEVEGDVHKYGFPFIVVFDTESLASGSLNPTGTAPFTVVVDKNLDVVFSHEGYLSGDLEKIEKVALDALGK